MHLPKPHITSACLLKILITVTIIIGILLYVVNITVIRLPPHISSAFFSNSEPFNWDIVRKQQERKWDKSYFVNTPGCKMPSFPVLDKTIHTYLTNETKIVCRKPLTKSNNNFLWISMNATEINNLYGIDDVTTLICYYQTIVRKTDDKNTIDDRKVYIRYGDVMQVSDEFVQVTCHTKNDEEVYRDYHYFVPQKRLSVVAKIDAKTMQNDGDAATHSVHQQQSIDDRLSVMIVGIDSVSRLNFHRQMSKSADVILNKLQAIELFGYNKIKDNTYPNLIPALTGLDEDELAAACLPYKNSTYDKCHFIWNQYAAQGYRTLYAEDMASLSLFNYLREGFSRAPTDYYLRPVLLEMEKNVAAQKKGNAHMCLGDRRPFDVILDYMTKFIYSIGLAPYFSLFWSTSYTHDYFNFPQLIDRDLATFLDNLADTNALNNTFLLLLSDHGIRFGAFRKTYQGMMEERQPFLYLIPPKWFATMYPTAVKNLLTNRRKLTTHFDLYETLHDLLHYRTLLSPTAIRERSTELLDIDPMPRGISLFLPIPPSRTCYMAGVSAHWCTCHERQTISTTDSSVQKVARMIVDSINRMVKVYPQCQTLSLNSISDANVGISNTGIVNITRSASHGHNMNMSNHFRDITVRMQTKPGFAEFEATVRVHENGELELTGSISRTNLYGKQSYCVDDYKIKLYCFCDSFL